MQIDKKLKKTLLLVVVAIIILGLGYWWWTANNQPGQHDVLAKCLKEKGAKFYGAFWCPHCQNQKTSFGTSARHLPYIECSTVDGNGQLPACKQANVQAYPTWEFPDGSRHEGELTMQELADKTGCPVQ